jgi:hypothetical protein
MLGTTFITGIGVPLILVAQRRQDESRAMLRIEMHERLTHLDACIDDLKIKVLGESASRTELSALRADVIETINRIRTAISVDTSGLHDRIMRLEDVKFRES